MKRYVVGFMFSEDEKEVLLIEKQTPAWQKGFLNGIGGKLEEGESAAKAMVREFQEETGLHTKLTDWQPFVRIYVGEQACIDFYSYHSNKLYTAKTIEQEVVSHYLVQNLPKNVMPNLRWLIPLSLDKKVSFEEPIVIHETIS